MANYPNLKLVDHPLVQHKLAILRKKSTPTRDFKSLVDEIGTLMAYEALKDLPLTEVEIETPLEPCMAKKLAGKKMVLVPILRAGLGMVDGISRLVPSARVGHIGLFRDHDTLQPVDYYFKVPSDQADRRFVILDPMLATGGSMSYAVKKLKSEGAVDIRAICLVAAPEGVQRMLADHPNVPVFVAALDRQLNDVGYILPGLGDAGDRIFGTS
jgi:uracil phosphoribosyltransferase